jgi:hypothetical protein
VLANSPAPCRRSDSFLGSARPQMIFPAVHDPNCLFQLVTEGRGQRCVFDADWTEGTTVKVQHRNPWELASTLGG